MVQDVDECSFILHIVVQLACVEKIILLLTYYLYVFLELFFRAALGFTACIFKLLQFTCK